MYKWMRLTCERWGDRPFIGRISYRDVLRMSENVIQDARANDRIIVSEPNSALMIARLLALWRVGSVPCLISPNVPVEKKQYCTELVKGTQGDEALILFTSSTSGSRPKGVRLGHRGLLAHIDMLREHVPRTVFHGDDRTFAFLPWTHCYGLMGECMSVMDRGASMGILDTKSFDPYRFVWGLHRTSPTILFVVPRVLDVLMPYPKWCWGGERLRYIVSGGAYLDPVKKRAFMHRHRIPILQGYGMTEMSPMVSLQNHPDACTGEDVGTLLPGVRARIDPVTEEILVHSPAKALGYLNHTEWDRDAFYRTGDTGALENDRLLTVRGRLGDMIKLPNGRFASLATLEQDLLRKHPWIKELCLWQENGRTRGILYGSPPSSDKAIRSDFKEMDVKMVNHSFADVRSGTLTLKGEISRHAVRARYNHLWM